MKRIISLLLALFLLASLTICVSAADYEGNDELLLLDEAELLTEAEAKALHTKLEQLSHKYGAQVCIATMSALEDADIDEFVEFLYDEAEYGYGEKKDGVLLLICMDPREFRILSNGFAADAITLDYIETITDDITPDLSEGSYADAFDTFVDKCEYYLDGHTNGFPFNTGMNLLIAIGVGLVVALIVTGIWKGQLKSVRKQERASVYVKPGSMNLTQSGDFYMYRTVTRTAKPKSNSSSSSGGSSRNVGGGAF